MTCHTETLAAALTPRDGRSHAVTMDRADLANALEDLHAVSFAWALGCCRRNRDEAEEVLQNVYVMVLDGKARFDGRSSLKTWLFGVIRRVSLAHARRRWLRANLVTLWFRPQLSTNDDASNNIEIEQSVARLATALRTLPQRQREVIELVFYHDMTVDQAAQVMRIGAGSARVHYDRAKKHLRMLLSEVTP